MNYLNIFILFLQINNFVIKVFSWLFLLILPPLYFLNQVEPFGLMLELNLSLAPPFSFASGDLFTFLLVYIIGITLLVISLSLVSVVLKLSREVKQGEVFTRQNYIYIELASYYSAYLVFLSYIFFDTAETLSLTFLGMLFLFTLIFKKGIELQEDNNLTI